MNKIKVVYNYVQYFYEETDNISDFLIGIIATPPVFLVDTIYISILTT